MPKKRVLSPQSAWDEAAVTAAVLGAGGKAMHVDAVYSHMLRHPDAAPGDAPTLPTAVRAALAPPHFARRTSTLLSASTSAGGDATKLLLRLQDGLAVEAVVMRYDTRVAADGGDRGTGGQRATLCVSSQAGCAMGCTFCATGTMGLLGDLTAGEIVEQLDHAAAVLAGAGGGQGVRGCRGHVRNVVFMGMGEPLNNYDAVVAAVRCMTASPRWSLRRAGVTVSTVGVVPRVRSLATDLPGVSLALSLHAPTQALRATIVPSARAYPLPRLMDAVAAYQAESGRRVFVEYVLLAGVNDGAEAAAELAALLAGRDVVVNLIPWNPVFAAEGREAGSPEAPEAFAAPAEGAVAAFAAAVRAAGLPVTVRAEKGQDISGACGQLVVQAGLGKGGGGGGGGCAPATPAPGGGAGGAARDIEELAAGRR